VHAVYDFRLQKLLYCTQTKMYNNVVVSCLYILFHCGVRPTDDILCKITLKYTCFNHISEFPPLVRKKTSRIHDLEVTVPDHLFG